MAACVVGQTDWLTHSQDFAADLAGLNDAVISVQAESPTDNVRFSTDYGNCWHRIDLPKALDVQNIRSALWNNRASHEAWCDGWQLQGPLSCGILHPEGVICHPITVASGTAQSCLWQAASALSWPGSTIGTGCLLQLCSTPQASCIAGWSPAASHTCLLCMARSAARAMLTPNVQWSATHLAGRRACSTCWTS